MQKKMDKLVKIIDSNDMKILEKDKEIKLYQVKLREFLQKNMKDLPM